MEQMRVSRAGRRDRGKAGLLPKQARAAGQGAQGALIDLQAARTHLAFALATDQSSECTAAKAGRAERHGEKEGGEDEEEAG